MNIIIKILTSVNIVQKSIPAEKVKIKGIH